MPEVERKKRDPKQPSAEDVVVKVGKFRIYFQNYYTILSLINDLLLGGLYFIGSLITLLDGPEWVRKYAYFAGAFFMLMRPLLKIGQNIFIYDRQEFQKEVAKSFYSSKMSENKKHNDSSQDEYGETRTHKQKREIVEEKKEN